MSFFVNKNKTEKAKFYLYFDEKNNICIHRDKKEDLVDNVNLMVQSIATEFSIPLDREKTEIGEIYKISINGQDVKYEEKNLNEITLEFKVPNHSEVTYLQSISTKIENGSFMIDGNRYNDYRLKALLIDWSLVDENGDKIPVSEDSIDNLNQRVFQVFSTYLNYKIPNYLS